MPGDLFHNSPQQRLLALIKLLRGNRVLTKAEILDRLGISERTFHNDMERLRKDLKAPIGWDTRVSKAGAKEYVWFLRDRDWSPEPVQVSERDLFSLLVARQIVEQYAGLPVGHQLKGIYERLAGLLHDKVTIHPDQLADISFAPAEAKPVTPGVWNAVLEATRRRRTLRTVYEGRWKGEKKTRQIDPYHIVNLQGEWYVIGTAGQGDPRRRQYALTQIRSAEVTDHAFDVPADFDIRKILDNTFGRFIGDPANLVDVKVRFSRRVAPLVLSRRFHPKERKEQQKNGDVVVSFPVTPTGVDDSWRYYHVRSWILSWGPDIRVLAPDELRMKVRADVQAMMKQSQP
jgi:predicted DNA-binding transcriptional regulator YafY